MSKAARRLRELLDSLERLSPDSWSDVQAWTAEARTLFEHAYPQHLPAFNKYTEAPQRPFYGRIIANSPSVWDDGRALARRQHAESTNASQKAKEDKVYRQRLTDAHQSLVAFVKGVLALEDIPPADATEKSPTIVETAITNITHSNIGFAAVGASPTVTGPVNASVSTTIDEEALKSAVTDLQHALIKVQDQLNNIDERLYDALSQILINIRKLQLAQADMATVSRLVKESVDDLWSKDAWNDVKPQLLPKLAKAIELLIGLTGHPLAQDIAKAIPG